MARDTDIHDVIIESRGRERRPVARQHRPERRRGPAGLGGGPRADAATGVGQGARRVRHHPHRLRAVPGAADRERADGGRPGHHAAGVRVLRAAWHRLAGRHHREGQGTTQSRPGDPRHPRHDVRRRGRYTPARSCSESSRRAARMSSIRSSGARSSSPRPRSRASRSRPTRRPRPARSRTEASPGRCWPGVPARRPAGGVRTVPTHVGGAGRRGVRLAGPDAAASPRRTPNRTPEGSPRQRDASATRRRSRST